jgi:hypothetical protein
VDVLIVEQRATAITAAITVATGAAQIAVPAFLLPLLKAEASATAAHLFATVGVFMVVFGGAVLHALSLQASLAVVLLWAGLQKLGAAAMVALAVSRGVFAPVALLVAAFDFASSLLFFDLRRRSAR